MNPRSQDSYTQAYNKWIVDKSQENMGKLLDAFLPTINSEILQYSGNRDLLRSRARVYAIQAIKSFNPMGTAKLNSWIVTNLKQLSRYGKRLRPVRASEDVIRDAAELNRVRGELEDELGRAPTDEELTDETGWGKKRLDKLRHDAVASVSGGADPSETADEGFTSAMDMSTQFADEVPFARDAVYMSLPQRDKDIFDYKLGMHGKPAMSGTDIAKKLGVTSALISQRSSDIGRRIADIASGGGNV